MTDEGRGPTSVFTAELAAIHMAMDHIDNETLGRYLLLTDSMSSIRVMESRQISLYTHPFVYECKQKCWQLTLSVREVSFMWVPTHVGIAGTERVDFEARQATLGNMVYNAQSVAQDLLPIAKQRMLDEWQKSWEVTFPRSFLDHGLRNEGMEVWRGFSRGTAELEPY
jgi:ribonuclease HI